MLVSLHLEDSVQSQVVNLSLYLISVLGGNQIPSLIILLEELREYGPLTLTSSWNLIFYIHGLMLYDSLEQRLQQIMRLHPTMRLQQNLLKRNDRTLLLIIAKKLVDFISHGS